MSAVVEYFAYTRSGGETSRLWIKRCWQGCIILEEFCGCHVATLHSTVSSWCTQHPSPMHLLWELYSEKCLQGRQCPLQWRIRYLSETSTCPQCRIGCWCFERLATQEWVQWAGMEQPERCDVFVRIPTPTQWLCSTLAVQNTSTESKLQHHFRYCLKLTTCKECTRLSNVFFTSWQERHILAVRTTAVPPLLWHARDSASNARFIETGAQKKQHSLL